MSKKNNKNDLQGYGTFLSEKVHHEVQQRLSRKKQVSTSRWMAKIPSDTLLSDLSIPGTHDSAAHGSIWPFVSTQNLDIHQQLHAGIRYFDLRCGLRSNELQMVHGTALLGQTLVSVLETMYSFLSTHASEGLMVQIKQDRAPENSTTTFVPALWTLLDTRPQFWRTFPTTPTMDELRGKIQLFRRFEGPPYRGIDVSRWLDNPPKPFVIQTWAGVEIVIQDHYNPSDPEPLPRLVADKGADVSAMLMRAARDMDAGRWYVNFVSAYQFNFYYQTPPKAIAMGGWWDFVWVEGLNPRLEGFLKTWKDETEGRSLWKRIQGSLSAAGNDDGGSRGKRRRFGVILMDFPDAVPDLISTVIESNFVKKKRKTKVCQPVHLMALFLLLVFVAGALLLLIHGPVDRRICPSFLHACVPRAAGSPWHNVPSKESQ